MITTPAYKNQLTDELFDQPDACLRAECWNYRDQAVRILMDTHLLDSEAYLQRRLDALWSSLKALREHGRELCAARSTKTEAVCSDEPSNVVSLKKTT